MAQQTQPYAAIRVGALPANNGICMTFSTGNADTTFMDKGIKYNLSMVCNAKNEDAKAASDALFNIHRALTQTKTYPQTQTYQITDISTQSMPNYIETEPSTRQTLYGSALRVSVYIPV